MSRLILTPVAPVASQRDFFTDAPLDELPADAVKRGDALYSYRRFDRGLSDPIAASLLGITQAELLQAEKGAMSFDLEHARRLLRGEK